MKDSNQNIYFANASSYLDSGAKNGDSSIITKDVKGCPLVYGNPAIQDGWVSEFGNKLNFNSNGIALCIQKYILKNNIVTLLNDKKL